MAACASTPGTSDDLFGSVSEENVERIKRQNSRKISVIIGNPPYNANQLNENENNKNREYPDIDKRIKETYIAESTAQKTKLYDMYARFFRWASDRLDENGVARLHHQPQLHRQPHLRRLPQDVAAGVQRDLRGGPGRRRARQPEAVAARSTTCSASRPGVAISFLVKRSAQDEGLPDLLRAAAGDGDGRGEAGLPAAARRLADVAFDEVRPDARRNWVNLTSNDFDTLAASWRRKAAKAASQCSEEQAIFKLFSLGVVDQPR